MGRTEAMAIARTPRASAAPAQPEGSSRRVYRLGQGWAIAVNRNIVAALGLGALVWASIAGIAWALIPA